MFSNFKSFQVPRILTIPAEVGVFQQPQAIALRMQIRLRRL